MNLVGIWKVKEALAFDEDGGKWLPVQECMDREDMDDETKSFLSARFVFEPDGLFKIVMAIPDGVPQEKIDQAAAYGIIHKNAAAHKKSQFTKAFNKIGA